MEENRKNHRLVRKVYLFFLKNLRVNKIKQLNKYNLSLMMHLLILILIKCLLTKSINIKKIKILLTLTHPFSTSILTNYELYQANYELTIT